MISPDGDGIDDALAVSYTLDCPSLRDGVGRRTATGAVVVDARSRHSVQGARRQSFNYSADGLADGAYTLVVSAAGEEGRTGRLVAPFGVDRTLSGLALSTATLTPNGDGVDDTLGIAFTLSSSANVAAQIEQAGRARRHGRDRDASGRRRAAGVGGNDAVRPRAGGDV